MVELAEEHSAGCRCVCCVCRRYLNWRSPEQREASVKITRWDGSAGTGEPDRALDVVVSSVDMELALDGLTNPWLRLVGRACRDVAPGKYRPPGAAWDVLVPWPSRAAIAPDPEKWVERPAFFVVNRLRNLYPLLWQESVKLYPEFTLSHLKQRCAEEMALVLGTQFGAEPRLSILSAEEPDPVRYSHHGG